MHKEEKIRQLLYRFENAGLVDKDVDMLMGCFSSRILGIGLGEQGFVTSLEEVRDVFESGLKVEDTAVYTVDYNRIEIMPINETVAIVCANVQVNSHSQGEEEKIIRSRFQQSLTVVCEQGEWKICGLHASAPIITEEDIEAYPLKIAEKTLQNLREKIGEEVYAAEEQYRMAILSDAVAFYIVNFSANCFEQCQIHNDMCAFVEDGTSYDEFVKLNAPQYVFENDRPLFLDSLSLSAVKVAYANHENEVTCEYRMRNPRGGYLWTKTIIRLIKDVATGDIKGIMYVKNIDDEKREVTEIREKATFDSMTKVLNKGTLIQQVDNRINGESRHCSSAFIMIDADDFKGINDNFGHPAGDQVLIAIAEKLKEIFGECAVIGRLGGDEFCVFQYEEQQCAAIEQSVNCLLESIRHMKLPGVPKLRISVSVGVVRLVANSFDELYGYADTALYEAKKRGKDNAVFINKLV